MYASGFNEVNFNAICDKLAIRHDCFRSVIETYGYPSMQKRRPSFASLVQIILEQQVSLASAKAAFTKLATYVVKVTPSGILQLSDSELKACTISRQKSGYIRNLAHAFVSKRIQLKMHKESADDEIRNELMQVKGIGNWTADVYLMFCLQRPDVFPINDRALIISLHEMLSLKPGQSSYSLNKLTEKWKPYRTVAAFLCWHAYIEKRKSSAGFKSQ